MVEVCLGARERLASRNNSAGFATTIRGLVGPGQLAVSACD